MTTDLEHTNLHDHVTWLSKEVARLQHQLRNQATTIQLLERRDSPDRYRAVVEQAHAATAWWMDNIDRLPRTITAPWVAPLNLALRELDKHGS